VTSTERPELSEEELRAYLEQLREADATEILVQAYTMLGTGAEVKLGRPDARVLIDAMTGLASAVGPRLGELGQRMQAGVQQLQLAQVEAERQAATPQNQPGPEPATEPAQPQTGQQSPPPGRPGGDGGAAGAGGGGGQQRMTDRLWIPGRDPGPRPR
jgi:hypothetical protein